MSFAIFDMWSLAPFQFPTSKKANILFLSQSFQLTRNCHMQKRYCELSYNMGLSKIVMSCKFTHRWRIWIVNRSIYQEKMGAVHVGPTLPDNTLSPVTVGLDNSLRKPKARRALPHFLRSRCKQNNFPFSESMVMSCRNEILGLVRWLLITVAYSIFFLKEIKRSSVYGNSFCLSAQSFLIYDFLTWGHLTVTRCLLKTQTLWLKPEEVREKWDMLANTGLLSKAVSWVLTNVFTYISCTHSHWQGRLQNIGIFLVDTIPHEVK